MLEEHARHDIFVISDADVRVPSNYLSGAVPLLRDAQTGLVNSFYRLANAKTLAMQWEAIAINADFWSQVLQARALKPLDFALGAAMLVRRADLDKIGGFESLRNCLADDYQLGNRIAALGRKIELSPEVVECRSAPMDWEDVWHHQLRWARTIRVCQPTPYFFSILSNAGLWPILWFATEMLSRGTPVAHVAPISLVGAFILHWKLSAIGACGVRMTIAADLQRRLTGSLSHLPYCWLAPIKDLLQAGLWLSAFVGNRIEWRGRRFTLKRDGTLVQVPAGQIDGDIA